jgi:hypothetical protein
MSEIPSGKASVGTILGAMVYQISLLNEKTKKKLDKELEDQGLLQARQESMKKMQRRSTIAA